MKIVFILALALGMATPGSADPFDAGRELRRSGQWQQSILSLQSALKTAPEKGAGWYELGLSYAGTFRYTSAADAYRLAVAKGCVAADCHCALALALRESGQVRAAEAPARRCIGLAPTRSGAYNLLGNVLTDQGRLVEARDAYARALDLKPGYANARYNLGLTLLSLGSEAKAEEELSEALRLDPASAEAWVALGDARLRLGKAGAALKAYQAAQFRSGRQAEAFWGQARALRSLGRMAEAAQKERSYRRAVRQADQSAVAPTAHGSLSELEAWKDH